MHVHVRWWSLVIAGAACGGSGPTGGGGAPPPSGAQVANVSMTDASGAAPYAFSPSTQTVKVGTTVKWTNIGNTSHTSTSDATPTPIWDSRTVAPAGTTTCPPPDPIYPTPCKPSPTPPGTYQRTFSTVGTFQYHCEFHKLQGMTGTITVTP